MTTQNLSTSFSSDIEAYIAEKVLPLTQRQLVAYQFGDKANLPKNRGTTYTASRYSRVPLPTAALAEGVASVGEALTLSQVTATAQQWGDLIEITDVGELTIKHDLFKQAIKLTAMQLAETFERNTFNTLMSGTNVIYAGGKTARASLTATDVMSVTEINKAFGSMFTTGVPMFDGTMEEDYKVSADRPVQTPKEHYVSIMHPLPMQDLLANSTIVTAFSYSQVERLYTNELGEWGGSRFTRSNMVPSFTGQGTVTATLLAGGSLTTGTTIFPAMTGVNKITGYEELVYQVGAGVSIVTATSAALTVVTPTDTTRVYNIYLGTSSTGIANLGKSAQGPSSGGMAGMAVQLPAATTITLTALGTAQTPPSPPASGVTVYPTFWIGKGSYTIVNLDNAKFFYLRDADKSDPQNQLRIVSWKVFYGTLINNQAFLLRTESGTAYTNAITNGTLT